MTDINELRQSLGTVQPEEVAELLDRLEAAEKDIALKERIIDSLGSELNAVANERDALRAAVCHEADCVEACKAEVETLRAKIEAMERQEPVARFNWSKGKLEWLRPWNYSTMNMKPLYLASSVQQSYLPSDLAEAIIADMQAQYNSEMITENDSGEALIRLDGAIAAVEDNFA